MYAGSRCCSYLSSACWWKTRLPVKNCPCLFPVLGTSLSKQTRVILVLNKRIIIPLDIYSLFRIRLCYPGYHSVLFIHRIINTGLCLLFKANTATSRLTYASRNIVTKKLRQMVRRGEMATIAARSAIRCLVVRQWRQAAFLSRCKPAMRRDCRRQVAAAARSETADQFTGGRTGFLCWLPTLPATCFN